MSRYSSRSGSNSLYVRNIPDDSRPEDIKQLFSKYGPVTDVYIPLDYYTRRGRGFAYVQFDDPRDAEEALYNMDGVRFCGRELGVEYPRGERKTPIEMRQKDRRSTPSYRRRDRGRSGSRSPRRRRSRSGSRRGRSRSRDRSRRRRSHTRSRSGSDERRRRERKDRRASSGGDKSRSRSRSADKNKRDADSRDRSASKD